MERSCSKKPELWGGIECSFNRVKDFYMDQLHYCGHYRRVPQDIEAIATLGVTKIRYPVIWERLQSHPAQSIDWTTVDLPLNELRDRGIEPIIGLVHHGSGPRHADILTPSFVSGLASFSAHVAKRFPWVQYYTPVNEPLTTARFSCLYGLWFPHRRSDRAFVQALLNEMKAVVLAMREIRKINPAAKLIQTEDLPKTYSTPHLNYQADFENHRRWLTFDILCGKLDQDHPLWNYFLQSGASESALRFFVDNPCVPDILGLDYYATSERYLDEALDKYPRRFHGGNHRERYADVEAFRARHDHPSGIQVLLKECWKRYELPMAVTEVHIGCDSDNQIRWFSEIRNACIAAINNGADIRAITAWSLLGCFGWSNLLTKQTGEYEPGVFDIRPDTPMATPLADYITHLSTNRDYVHPAESEPGWWRRDDRFIDAIASASPDCVPFSRE
jgi:dTDP-4-dehydrorhamnose reductase